jgi:hypothetical protein
MRRGVTKFAWSVRHAGLTPQTLSDKGVGPPRGKRRRVYYSFLRAPRLPR